MLSFKNKLVFFQDVGTQAMASHHLPSLRSHPNKYFTLGWFCSDTHSYVPCYLELSHFEMKRGKQKKRLKGKRTDSVLGLAVTLNPITSVCMSIYRDIDTYTYIHIHTHSFFFF